MGSEDIITVSGLCKIFDIYDNPADRVKEIFSLTRKKYAYKYTALSDISFSIKKGEFIGVVGRNGAGKSTLLKILSGYLTATNGTVNVNGTISLLQLGVGFNKELSGIDNIRFSSRLLGHNTSTIDAIISEVVEFADIGEFIYHPVKTYSSGMYSRLAFAIGITINPDILIVDEVLSVGDMQFASKCLSKMHDLKRDGKTAIIVTHDVEKVAVFCDRAIWLKDTHIKAIGKSKEVVEEYRDYMLTEKKVVTITDAMPIKVTALENKTQLANNQLLDHKIEWVNIEKYKATISNGNAKITCAAIYDLSTLEKSNTFLRGDTILLYLKITSNSDIPELVVGWNLIDKKGLIAIHSGSNFCGNKQNSLDI